MSLSADLATQLARIESLSRAKGLVTSQLLADALPTYVVREIGMLGLRAAADKVNAALAEAERQESAPVVRMDAEDFKSRAAGENT